ncbi:MAG: rhomboid family intramembrane serine protease [Pseudomonadaceae bacterium]|nr:rhomboid family intramembrane serine protease [Pseudomonadaceae bacterium]
MLPLADNNPTRIVPLLTWGLIAMCVLAFVGQNLSPYGFEWSVYTYGFIPVRLFANPETAIADHNIAHALEELETAPWQTLFTSMFMHGSLAHIGGNMLYLYIFGDNLENDMGRPRFLAFYLLCGLAAALAQGLVDPTSAIPMVGASGAIAGVLGGYLVLHPRQRITVLIPNAGLTQMPALIVLGMWFAYQFILGVANMGGEGGGVAFWAHIGGFVAGVVLVRLFTPRS